jgi:hypothetical protein
LAHESLPSPLGYWLAGILPAIAKPKKKGKKRRKGRKRRK